MVLLGLVTRLGMPGQREPRIVKLPSGLVFYPDKRFISRLEKLNWMTVLQYQLLKGNG